MTDTADADKDGFAAAITEYLAKTDMHDPQRLRSWLLDSPQAARRDGRSLIAAIVAAYDEGIDVAEPAAWPAIRNQLVNGQAIAASSADAALTVWADARHLPASPVAYAEVERRSGLGTPRIVLVAVLSIVTLICALVFIGMAAGKLGNPASIAWIAVPAAGAASLVGAYAARPRPGRS